MYHRTRPTSMWAVAAAFTMIAALFAAIGSTPAAAQTGPTIVNPGSQAHDVGHRACTSLQTNITPDRFEARNLPPGIGISQEADNPTTAVDESRLARLDGRPSRAGTWNIVVRAFVNDVPGPEVTIPYRVFGPDASVPVIKAGRLHRAFTIDCFSQGWVANEFISNPANFGSSGRVRLRSGLPIHEHTTLLTAAYLADADILFDGFVGDFGDTEYTRSELDLVKRWVENDGGVLITTADHPDADGLARLFGVRTESHELPPRGSGQFHCGNPIAVPAEPACPQFRPAGSAGSHPIVNGPFGPWRAIGTDGSVGYLQRNISGWNRVANHPNGNPAIIERKAGNGHVVVISDEGTLRMNLAGDNGRFLGNLVAFALAQVTDIPVANNDVLVGRAFQRFSADICRNDDLGDGRNRARIIAGSLGPDLRLRGCRITGTPRSLGNWQATYRLTDADGDTDTAFISVTVNGAFGAADSNPTCAGRPATIVGTPGDDIIRGTRGADVIVAGRGNDTVRGLGGNDIICGNQGRDVINGGPGRDICQGGPGRNTIRNCEARRR